MDSIYLGIVVAVYPPNHEQNVSKYQYEYAVMVSMQDYAQIRINNAVISDPLGQIDDYDYAVLDVGCKVLVAFVNKNRTAAVILGGLRNYAKPILPDMGVHWTRRFNRIEMGIDQTNSWFIKSDHGPHARVEPNQIKFDDSQGQSIVIDKPSKTITISSENWTVNIRKNATINVGDNANISVKGDCTLSVEKNANVTVKQNLTASVEKNATINVKENVTARCKQLDAKVDTNAKVKAGSKVEVKGREIVLNEGISPITTELSHMGVVDLITGVPVVGVKTIKAG